MYQVPRARYLVHQALAARPSLPAVPICHLCLGRGTGALHSPGPHYHFQTRRHLCNDVGSKMLMYLVHQVPSPYKAGRLLDTAAVLGFRRHALSRVTAETCVAVAEPLHIAMLSDLSMHRLKASDALIQFSVQHPLDALASHHAKGAGNASSARLRH